MNTNQFTMVNGKLIETALRHYYPDATVRVEKASGAESVNSVSGTIQGAVDGEKFNELLSTVAVANRKYSIYRSGTGLTIKFI